MTNEQMVQFREVMDSIIQAILIYFPGEEFSMEHVVWDNDTDNVPSQFALLNLPYKLLRRLGREGFIKNTSNSILLTEKAIEWYHN